MKLQSAILVSGIYLCALFLVLLLMLHCLIFYRNGAVLRTEDVSFVKLPSAKRSREITCFQPG